MPKCNQKCKLCNDLFYVCTCDKSLISKNGYCSYECWVKLPLLDRLEMAGEYEAADEIRKLQAVIDGRR